MVIVSDSESENGAQDIREAEAKESRKQPAKEECVTSPKVPSLENATMSLEISSNLSVINSDVFSSSVKSERKRQYEEPDDVIKIKKHVYKHKLRRLEKKSITRTACKSEVFDIVSDYDEIEEKDVNTSSRSTTALDIGHDSGLAADSVSNSDSVSISKIVENELKSNIESVALPSEVSDRCKTNSASCVSVPLNSATSNTRNPNNEEAVTNHKRSTQPAQTIIAEPEMLHNCITNSISMDTTVFSVPFGGIKCENEGMEIGLNNSVRRTVCEGFRTDLLNSRFSCITNNEVVSLDDDLQRVPAMSTCNVNKEKQEHYVERALHKELSVGDIKSASKPSIEGLSLTVSKTLSPGIKGADKWLETGKAEHTGSVGACISSMLESCLTSEGARITKNTCITTPDKAVSQLNVKVQKDASPCSLYGRNNDNGSMEDSGVLEHCALKTENFPIETLISDDEEQLVIKNGKERRRRLRIISVSSSDEDVERERCRKQLESPEQTRGNGNSCVQLQKRERALLFTSENSTNSDCTQFEKTSTGSVAEVSARSSESHTSVQNSMGSVDEYKGENVKWMNKNAGSSGFVEGKTLSDKLCDQISKDKAVVKLERLEESTCKSDKLIVSEPASECLNYTLNEDIIVVSDDSDEDFPSSQIFNDQKPSVGLLKTLGKDTAHEEPVFCKVEDVDELVFEDDDSDFDDNWFKKLSQQDLEPPQHLPVETERKDTGSREGSLKENTLPQVATDGVGMEKVTLAGDLLKTCHGVKQKHKHTCNAQTLMIDAPPLPPRRAFQRGISAEVATRMYKEKTDIGQEVVKSGNIVSNTTSRKERGSRKKKIKLHVSVPDDLHNLTAKQKKQIADKRKEKLKAISEREKVVAMASREGHVKVPAEVRIKVTKKNRGAFLMEGADSTDGGAELSNIAETSVSSSAVKNLHLDVKNIQKQSDSKESAPRCKRRESRSSSAPVSSIKFLPRIPRKSERPSSSSGTELEVPSDAKVETISVDRFPILNSAISTLPMLKTYAPTRNTRKKKNVRFKDDSEMVQIRIIPVAEESRLLPVAHKKDAPTPRKVASKQLQQKGPDLEEVLYHILCWNPKWLMVSHEYMYLFH